MRKGGTTIFDTHKSWTHDAPPGMIEAVRRRERAELGRLPHVDIPPTFRDVDAYFEEHHPKLREADPSTIEQEEVLMDDLWHAYATDADDVAKDRIRRLIWAVSQTVNKNADPDAAARILITHEADARREIDHALRVDPSDLREEYQDRLGRIEDALTALTARATGEDIRATVETIEAEYSSILNRALHGYNDRMKKNAEHELSDLRIVRDETYARLLYPNLVREKKRRRKA